MDHKEHLCVFTIILFKLYNNYYELWIYILSVFLFKVLLTGAL